MQSTADDLTLLEICLREANKEKKRERDKKTGNATPQATTGKRKERILRQKILSGKGSGDNNDDNSNEKKANNFSVSPWYSYIFHADLLKSLIGSL